MMDCRSGERGSGRVVLVAIAILAGFILGLCGGVLSWLGGMAIPGAVLAGAGSWGGSVLCIIGVMHFVQGTGESR